MLAGAIAALAGTLAMDYAQRLWTRAAGEPPPDSAGGKHDARDWQERNEGQNANQLAAQAVARRVRGRPLTREELRVAAPAVHYAFGATVGALYGAYLEIRRPRARPTGLGLATTLWIAADEIAMPVLDLSGPTTERPVEKHLQAFAAHVVYGVVTEIVRRPVRAALGGGRPRTSPPR